MLILVVAALLGAWVALAIEWKSAISLLWKANSQLTKEEKGRIKQGLVRDIVGSFLVFAPANVTVAMAMAYVVAVSLRLKYPGLLQSPYIAEWLGNPIYRFFSSFLYGIFFGEVPISKLRATVREWVGRILKREFGGSFPDSGTTELNDPDEDPPKQLPSSIRERRTRGRRQPKDNN